MTNTPPDKMAPPEAGALPDYGPVAGQQPAVPRVPEVAPLATVPTRPAQDGIIDPVWGQWVHDETVRDIKMRMVTIPAVTFDANGLYTLNAAALGLATIDGCVFGVFISAWNPTAQNIQPITGTVFRASPSQVILSLHYYTKGVGTLARTAAGVTELHVVAWGTAA